jgi:hypothetical protein
VTVRSLFGGPAQIVVGSAFLALTVGQAWLWGIRSRPSSTGIFWLSIEALAFASYGVIATGLGYRKTEHVETALIASPMVQTDDEP